MFENQKIKNRLQDEILNCTNITIYRCCYYGYFTQWEANSSAKVHCKIEHTGKYIKTGKRWKRVINGAYLWNLGWKKRNSIEIHDNYVVYYFRDAPKVWAIFFKMFPHNLELWNMYILEQNMCAFRYKIKHIYYKYNQNIFSISFYLSQMYQK